MGKVIKRKIQGMSWWLKTGLVLLLTLAMSITIYKVRLDAAPTANGRLVYSINTTVPQSRDYTASSNTFAAAAVMQTGVAQRFMVDRAAPTRDEHIAGYVTNTGVLYIQRWNGSAWTAEWNVAVGGDGVNGRRFDIEYENVSGRAVVVYSTNVNGTAGAEMAYRVWDGATWTVAANLPNSARLAQAAAVTSIKMAARPGSNELAVMAADSGTTTANTALFTCFIWDGTSTWGNEPGTTFGVTYNTTGQLFQNDLFDLAYEATSGNLFTVFTIATPQQNYRTYSAGTWSAVTSFGGTGRAAPLQMFATPNPNSDQILVGWTRSASLNIYGIIWSGTALGTLTTIGADGVNPTAINKKHITGNWMRVGATDYAVAVWNTSTAGTLGYNYFTGAAWGTAATYNTGTGTNAEWLDCDVDPQSRDTLMLTFSNSAGDLWAKRLVLSAGPAFTWSNADGGTALTAGLGSITSQNFSFAYDRYSVTAPVLSTPTATSILSTTATLGANVTSDGGSPVTGRGTVWSTTTGPTIPTNQTTTTGTTGVFTTAVSSIAAGTKIFYRGYATNAVGTSYSPEGTFYTEPATQASGVNFTAVGQTGMNVNWTRGSGDGVIVLMKSASAVNSDPLDGTYTGYTANAAFGSGTQIGTGNYVIYKGTGTTVPVTGLTSGTTYYVAVYEYKGTVDTVGVDLGTSYDTPAAVANQITTIPCAAGTPTALTVGTETTSSVPLTWTGAGTTDYYRIYRNGVQVSTNGSPTTGAYTDSTVTSGATYPYTVSGYNIAGACESAQTAAVNAYVLPVTPAAPTVSNPGTGNTLIVAIGTDTNVSVVQYAIRINGGAYSNQYVQAGGNVAVGIVWQTKAAWASKTVTGLVAGTSYSFTVIARNTNGTPDQSAYGSAASGTPNVGLPSTITNCGGCHGYTGTSNPLVDVAGRNPVSAQGRFSGSHAVHTTQYSYACSKCHVNDAAYTNAHRNSLIEMASPINGDTGGVYVKGTSWTQTNSPTAYTACNGVYCHSQGTKLTSPYTGTNISPTTNLVWSSNRGTCGSCHGNPPSYTNVSPKANSHVEHISFPCNACHNRTTTNGSTITSVTRHVNKFYNISASGLKVGFGAYTARAKFTYAYVATFSGTAPNDGGSTCSVIYCHNGKNAKWGGSTTDTSLAAGVVLRCVDCHDKKIYRNKGRPNTILADAVSEFGLAWGHKKTGRGAVTDADCIVCHLEGVYATQKTSPTFHADGNIDLRDPIGSGEVAIKNISGGVFTFQRFSTSFAALSRTSTGHTSNTDIGNVVTQKFCLACHRSGGATNTTARTAGGTATMPFGGVNLGANYTVANGAAAVGGLVDVNSEFDPANSSVHPVRGPNNRNFPTAARLYAPYDNQVAGRDNAGSTKTLSVVITCFDCHNTTAGLLTTRTVAAHGNAVSLRGTYYVASPTLCMACHGGSATYATGTSTDHGNGSALTNSSNQVSMTNCGQCHGSAAAKPARPTPAQDYHGNSRLVSGAKWPAPGGSVYAFIRNANNFAYHRPKAGPDITTGTATCSNGGGCQMGTYTVGGSY